jgi:predicted transcriptional regulator of viral defense system
MRSSEVLDIARHAGGVSSAAELIERGARWDDLYRLRDSGELIELSRGVFRVADAPATAHLDLLAVCRRAPEGMICLGSAASFWDLSDELPDVVHLAIARGKHRPRIVYPPTRVHVFAAATFSLGRETEKIDSAETITISSKERTVVDLMRFRSRVGRDLAFGALRRYLQGADAKPGELLALARQLRIASVVSGAMEPLLA